ncbi:MAG: PIG-L family deacetylase [Verrucomicrobia bacterium]|nr:PIG-L family deacetylase [Verrucomicrobiota bacterium]
MSVANNNQTIFFHPDTLPIYSIAKIASSPVLVVAPHPDDECFGCGGAVKLLRDAGCVVHVLIVSDGTKSHPNSCRYPAEKLRLLRERETMGGLSILGVEPSYISFLRLPDGAVPFGNQAGFKEAVSVCAEKIGAIKPEILFVPWRYDPHRDHRATWEIVKTAGCCIGRMLEYPIWDYDHKQSREVPSTFVVWRLDIRNAIETKQLAIEMYRSQTTNLIDDDPDGSPLPAAFIQEFRRPWELFIEKNVRPGVAVDLKADNS